MKMQTSMNRMEVCANIKTKSLNHPRPFLSYMINRELYIINYFNNYLTNILITIWHMLTDL